MASSSMACCAVTATATGFAACSGMDAKPAGDGCRAPLADPMASGAAVETCSTMGASEGGGWLRESESTSRLPPLAMAMGGGALGACACAAEAGATDAVESSPAPADEGPSTTGAAWWSVCADSGTAAALAWWPDCS